MELLNPLFCFGYLLLRISHSHLKARQGQAPPHHGPFTAPYQIEICTRSVRVLLRMYLSIPTFY